MTPPAPSKLFVPPIPVPPAARRSRVCVIFDVDTTGHLVSVAFTRTPDARYNRDLAQVLRNVQFRPGRRADGTPIRMKTVITIDLP